MFNNSNAATQLPGAAILSTPPLGPWERRKTVDPLQKDFILYLNFKGVKADEIHRITAWSLKTVRRNIAAHSKQDFIRVHPDFERRFLERESIGHGVVTSMSKDQGGSTDDDSSVEEGPSSRPTRRQSTRGQPHWPQPHGPADAQSNDYVLNFLARVGLEKWGEGFAQKGVTEATLRVLSTLPKEEIEDIIHTVGPLADLRQHCDKYGCTMYRRWGIPGSFSLCSESSTRTITLLLQLEHATRGTHSPSPRRWTRLGLADGPRTRVAPSIPHNTNPHAPAYLHRVSRPEAAHGHAMGPLHFWISKRSGGTGGNDAGMDGP
ncbi:hypothetical protein C8J57DRAFT_1728740 [Mycena rebaudengoi]|nr:hypothetical protein C8J57DRAFT_1728740 [Mycena rebaudengoi]